MNNILDNILDNSILSITSIITYTMFKEPHILEIMNNINEIDPSVLDSRLKSFFNNDIQSKLDTSQIIFLCTLMYKNDIFPTFIFNTLNKLGALQGLTIQDLKNNSENLIDLLLSKTKGGVQKGGADFMKIMSILYQISFILAVIMFDYYYFSHTIWSKIQDKGTKIMESVSILKDGSETCNNINVPDSLIYYNKYFAVRDSEEDNNLLNTYKIISCVANKWMNNYLLDEVFTPEQFKQGNLQTEYSNALVLFDKEKQKITTDVSLVPSKVSSNEVTIQVIQNQILPIGQNAENILNGLIIYGETNKQNIETTKTELQKYIDMNNDQLLEMLRKNIYQQTKIEEKISNPTTFGRASEFASDSYLLLRNLFNTATKEGNGISFDNMAFDITKSYARIIKDFCKQQLRNIEDLQTKSNRKLEDFVLESERLLEDLQHFIRYLPYLYAANIKAAGIIIAYISILINKIVRKKPESLLAISNEQLAIDNKGGRSRKYRKIRKTRKNKKNRTNKNAKKRRNQSKNKKR